MHTQMNRPNSSLDWVFSELGFVSLDPFHCA